MKYIKGEVISIKFPHKSFSWGNGLYVVIEISETELRMARLEENGEIEKFDDGRPMISVTGINNEGISRTKLTYQLK